MGPRLETDRLILRPPRGEDAPVYIDFFADAEASAFYGGPLLAHRAWGRMAQDIGHWHVRGYGVWAVEDRRTGAVVGVCGFAWPDGWPRRELTWWTAPDHRRRGFAREASAAAVVHALDVFGWTRVETHMRDENTAARRLVERLGGRRIAREPFPDGHDRDVFDIPDPRASA
jgi:ribosomal-protein-alanine N-acetyltransferase